MTGRIFKTIGEIVKELNNGTDENYIGLKASVRQACEYLQIAMFPCFVGKTFEICKVCEKSDHCSKNNPSERRTTAFIKASDCLITSLSMLMTNEEAEDITQKLLEDIPNIKKVLETDIEAGYMGDPAAKSKDEIILSYPAFTAICIYRIAHKLYTLGVRVIPRIMTEYAHELTGIDIHPGATIGEYFFIDHGTGVVIGETSTIGHHVKIYQNVTIGAKSFDINPDGSLVKGIKRHPDIGNNVVIYAGATILGGTTRIGDDCVIGGNVWLTHSVEDGKTIIAKD